MGLLNSKELIDGECLLPKFNPDNYKRVGDLGSGGFGVVSKLERVKKSSSKDGDRLPTQVALKIIQVRSPIDNDLIEYKILKEFSHKNILKLFYWKIVTVKDLPQHLYLYTELCDCNLKKYVYDNNLDSHICKDICAQMIQGCEYLHSHGVIHRDIKPENILIQHLGGTKAAIVKIADFGFARFMPKEDITSLFQVSTLGTKMYASPEIIRAFNHSEMVNPKSAFAMDIFSLGVIMFEIFAKKLPFSISDLGKVTFETEKIVKDNITDPMLVECLSQMLQWEPKLRPELKKISKFFIGQFDPLEYTRKSFLARGSFGSVFIYVRNSELPAQGQEVEEEEYVQGGQTIRPNIVAVKEILLEPEKKSDRHDQDLERELQILRDTDHRNVVKLLTTRTDEFNLLIYLEYCNGNLDRFMQEKEWTGDEGHVIPLAIQIARGLDYLHSKSIVHRDIKPTNILVKFRDDLLHPITAIEEVTIKISDFGLSRLLEDSGSSSLSVVGTKMFMSPETARAESDHSKKFRPDNPYSSDVFSAGVMFFRMRYGSVPFKFAQLASAEKVDLQVLDIWKDEESFFKDLCSGMMSWEPEVRPSMQDVVRRLLANKFFATGEISLDKSVKQKPIGRGRYGTVYKYDFPLQSPFPVVAVKELHLYPEENSVKNEKYNVFARREAEICSNLLKTNNKNVLQCFAVLDCPPGIKLVLEYCESTLKTFLRGRQLGLEDVKHLGRQIISGLSYLHDQNIIHRDMKSDNILLLKKTDLVKYVDLKICDFGLARYLPNTGDELTIAGTLSYMAPELFKVMANSVNADDFTSTYFTQSADIFSTGVIFYEMLVKKYPFSLAEMTITPEKVKYMSNIEDEDFRKLLMTMMNFEPNNRPLAKDVKNDNFFNLPKSNVK